MGAMLDFIRGRDVIMHDDGVPKRRKRTITRKRVLGFAIAFAISLSIGKLVESMTDRDTLVGLYRMQGIWIRTVHDLNPLSLLYTYVHDTVAAAHGHLRDDGSSTGAGLWAPLKGMWYLLSDVYRQGSVFTILQLGSGALVLGALNLKRTDGKTVLLGNPAADGRTFLNLVLWPPAAVLVASVLALALQVLMLGALGLFHWVTGLAAMAAGWTGVGAVCWFCFRKLGEQGIEHIVTPKL